MSEKSLFAQFGSVTPEQWKEKIIQDLKGKDYDQSLVWNTKENIKVQPFYTASESESRSLSRTTLQWQITAPIQISDNANREALQNLVGGANGVHFIGNGQDFLLENLTKDIHQEYAPLSFQNVRWTNAHISYWTTHADKKSHLGIDPLHDLHVGKSDKYDIQNLLPWLQLRQSTKAQWGVLCIDGSIYKNSGGHFIDEVAFIISALQENLHKLRDNGYKSNEIGTIQIRTATGPNFFFEIAKIKVIRTLAHIVANQYEGADIQILAESADIYHSQIDTPTNILRMTTECMSAIMGGADAVMLHSFDINENPDFTQRISRNIQHLLREESYFDQQYDPTAGNYYIEQLIQDLKTPAWNVFLSIEKHKGYVHSFVGKSIPEFFIFRHQLAINKDVAHRKTVLLGVNQFPNLDEKISLQDSIARTQLKTNILNTFRLSEPFENLRFRMLRHQASTSTTPLAYLLQSGSLTMRKARSAFSYNFLAAAGIRSMESSNSDFETTLQEIQTLQPDIVVICSDNDSWETFVPQCLEQLPKNTIKILAGKSDAYPVDFVIYEGANMIEILEKILDRLGIQ